MADHKLLYRWSLQDAIAHNEVQDWRDSYRENCDCARAKMCIRDSHQGHHGIHAHDDHGALAQILLLVQIGAVGNHDTGAQRQGEEHLPAGGCENLPEAGNLHF